MTYESEKSRLGREHFAILELDLDYCSNLYGGGLLSPLDGTCTATGAAGTECYNTRYSCQDTANFTKTTKTYSFCTPHPNLPDGVNMFPCIEGGIKFTPTEIKPDKGASLRSNVEITINDFSYHDRLTDPYSSTRSAASGLFFARLLARNPYYRGRIMRVKTGYMGSTYSAADLETRLYIIDKIEGPFRRGGNISYRITGTDMLSLSAGDRVKIPKPTDGTLASSLSAVATSGFTLSSGSTLADYPTGGTRVLIGDEVISYSSRSGSPETLCSTLTRGLNGTTADSHDAGDGVQVGRNFTGGPIDIIYEILNTDCGISAAYLPYGGSPQSAWDAEQSYWFAGVSLDVWIFDPSEAFSLLDEICEIFQIDIWWDEVTQQVKLKANVPPLGNASVTELSDESNLIEDKTSVKEIPSKRISRVLVKYGVIDVSAADQLSNYARHHFETLASAESSDTYNEIKAKIIKSRWLTSSEDGVASQTAQRLISRFSETPIEIRFSLDAKDSSLSVGSLCDITTALIQDIDGTDKTTRFQIISKKESEPGHRYDYKALEFYFSSRNAFIASNSLDTTSPKTVYNNATDAEKEANAFIGPNAGNFSDGGSLYLII